MIVIVSTALTKSDWGATFWLPLRTANYGAARFTSEIQQGARQRCKRGYCDEGVLQGCAAASVGKGIRLRLC